MTGRSGEPQDGVCTATGGTRPGDPQAEADGRGRRSTWLTARVNTPRRAQPVRHPVNLQARLGRKLLVVLFPEVNSNILDGNYKEDKKE